MNKKMKLNIFLNICLFILIGFSTYSWMLTDPSIGENMEYNKQLVITSSTVSVKVYEYDNGVYTRLTDSPFTVHGIAPGVVKQFRFDITNNNDIESSSNIVFANVTGDIEMLSDKLYFGGTSPKSFQNSLGSNLNFNLNENNYYYKFINSFSVPGGETTSLYWYITMDKTATNEVADKTINIESIIFIKP